MIGGGNPIPTQIGGSPSRVERVYRALQQMVGTNGYSKDDESIESYWRRAKAEALATLETFDERSMLQVFPNYASDHLPLFEEILGLGVDNTQPDQVRRNAIVPKYTESPRAWTGALNEVVQEIDSRMSIVSRDWLNCTTTVPGRAFEQYSPAAGQEYDPGGTRIATQFPNANDKNEAIIFFDIGGGAAPSREVLRRAALARSKVRAVLPSWCKTTVVYAIGFTLDSSLLDATGFGT